MIVLEFFFPLKNQNIKVILAIRSLNSRFKVNLTISVASMAQSAMMTSLTSKKQKNTCTSNIEWPQPP